MNCSVSPFLILSAEFKGSNPCGFLKNRDEMACVGKPGTVSNGLNFQRGTGD